MGNLFQRLKLKLLKKFLCLRYGDYYGECLFYVMTTEDKQSLTEMLEKWIPMGYKDGVDPIPSFTKAVEDRLKELNKKG